jgi:hypothetical protein
MYAALRSGSPSASKSANRYCRFIPCQDTVYAFRPTTPAHLQTLVSGLLSGLRDLQPAGVGWFPGHTEWFVASLQPPHEPGGLWLVDARNGRKALLLRGTRFGRPAVSQDARTLVVGLGVEARVNKPTGPVGLEVIRLPPLGSLRMHLK